MREKGMIFNNVKHNWSPGRARNRVCQTESLPLDVAPLVGTWNNWAGQALGTSPEDSPGACWLGNGAYDLTSLVSL